MAGFRSRGGNNSRRITLFLLHIVAAVNRVTCKPEPGDLQINSNIVGRSIPSTLFGVNIVYSWESDANWLNSRQTLYHTSDAFLRYPGGEVTSSTHILNSTGQGWKDSWSVNFNGVYAPQENWTNISEYASLVKDVGAAPMVGINARSGWKWDRTQDGLDDAKAVAELVRDLSLNVQYWFIDNEQYNEWNATEYAHYINLYAAEVRTVNKDAKFVANWGGNPSTWDGLLLAAGSNISVMDVHSYWSRDGWGTTSWDTYLSGTDDVIMGQWGVTYGDYVKQFKDKATAKGLPDMEVGLLEWGLSPSPEGEEPSRFQAAFIVADIFMQMLDSTLDHACYWPFRVPVGSKNSHRAMVDDSNEPTVIRLFFQFFRNLKKYTVVESSIHAAYTDVIAAKSNSDSKMVVYILRKTDTDVDISLNDADGFLPATANAVAYAAPEGDTMSDIAQWSQPDTAIGGSGTVTFAVPAWSLTRVVLEKAAGCPEPTPPPTPPPTTSPTTPLPTASPTTPPPTTPPTTPPPTTPPTTPPPTTPPTMHPTTPPPTTPPTTHPPTPPPTPLPDSKTEKTQKPH